MLGLPGQGPVSQSLREDDGRPRGGRDLLNHPVVCFEPGNVPRGNVVGLVAAGDTGESSVAGVRVGQVPPHDRQATAHPAVVKLIEVGEVIDGSASVLDVTLSARFHHDAVDVVDSETVPEDLDEGWHDTWMGKQVAERLTPRLGPGEHPVQVAPPLAALQLGRTAGQQGVPLPDSNTGGVFVDGFVQHVHLVARESVFDDEVAVNVEEIFLVVVQMDLTVEQAPQAWHYEFV